MAFWRRASSRNVAPPVLPLVKVGAPVLRQPAAAVSAETLESADTQLLIDRMIETMRSAPGVGLAAPQVGVGLAIAVLEDTEDRMQNLSTEERKQRGRKPLPLIVAINPQISEPPMPAGGDARQRRITFLEGCLSVPGYMGLVERERDIMLTAQDRHGERFSLPLSGWPARIAQHEVDHLSGTLYVDRMLTRSFSHNDEVRERWLHEPVTAMRRILDA